MTAQEVKQSVGKLGGRFNRSHGSSLLLGLAGAAMIVMGWSNPNVSDQIVQAVVGGVLSLFAGLQAQKNGLTKKLDEQDQRQKEVVEETVTKAMDKTYEQQMLSITNAIIRMGNSVQSLDAGQNEMAADIAAKHADNKGDHKTLIEALTEDKERNESQHAEHRERLTKLEAGQEHLGQQIGDVVEKVGELAQRIELRSGS